MNESDFLAIFQTELNGELQRATELALELEKAPDNLELINGLMREFHTIKGAARAIQFEEIKECAHYLEDIFHALLDNKTTFRPILIDITFFAIDLIRTVFKQQLAKQALPDHQCLEDIVQQYLNGDSPTLPQQALSSDIDQSSKAPIQDSSDIPKTEALAPDSEAHIESATGSPSTSKSTDEKLMDKLFNLSGEMVIAVGAFDPQRDAMRKVSQSLLQFQRHIEREGLHQLGANLQDIISQQATVLEHVNNTETRMRFLSNELEDQVNTARLVPLDHLFSTYPRLIRDLSKELNKSCELVLEGEQTRIDRGVLEAVTAPLMHILRNAIDHGIESPQQRLQQGKTEKGLIKIRVLQLGGQIEIHISDDGKGIDMQAIKQKVLEQGATTEVLWDSMDLFEQQQFLFLPGFSMAQSVTELSGRGVGLDIVKTVVEKVGGRVSIQSQLQQGTHFIIELPLTLSLTRCLLVQGGKHPFFGVQHYAFPENELDVIQRIKSSDIRTHEGREVVRINNQSIPLFSFANLMGLSPLKSTLEDRYVLVLGDSSQIALVVEQVVEEQAIVRRSFDQRLGKIPNIDGVSLLRNGEMALIVDMKDLYQTLSDSATHVESVRYDNTEDQTIRKILVVEDSQTVREVEKHFLESAGFEVITAVDGMDGLNKIHSHHFDLVISDIDMPRMNGVEMIKKVRHENKYKTLPIIVVSYKDREEDKHQAISAGANEYVVKSDFDTEEMIHTIGRLINNETSTHPLPESEL